MVLEPQQRVAPPKPDQVVRPESTLLYAEISAYIIFHCEISDLMLQSCITELALGPFGPQSSLNHRFLLLDLLLEASWKHLESSWKPVKCSWNPLGGVLRAPGGSGRHLGSSWRPLGTSWRPLGELLEASRVPLDLSGEPLGPSGVRFESSWGPLGPLLKSLGDNLVNSSKTFVFSMEFIDF